MIRRRWVGAILLAPLDARPLMIRLHLEVHKDGTPIDPQTLGLEFAHAQPLSAGAASDGRGGE